MSFLAFQTERFPQLCRPRERSWSECMTADRQKSILPDRRTFRGLWAGDQFVGVGWTAGLRGRRCISLMKVNRRHALGERFDSKLFVLFQYVEIIRQKEFRKADELKIFLRE